MLDQRPHPERGRPGPEGGHGEVQGLRPGAPTTADQLPDGQPCWISADCLSGVCEGQGCDDGHLGRCMPRTRVCTEDVSPFCGCDGRTFTASSSCPGTRYAKPDACR